MKLRRAQISEKQSQMLELLKYGTVMAFVDSRQEGVVVPEYLKNDVQLRLNFDYAFEIDDFRVLPDRIEASLSFNKKDFFCVVPFESVYLLINFDTQQGVIFEESLPLEMLHQFLNPESTPQESSTESSPKPEKKPPAPAPKIAAVVAESSPESKTDSTPAPESASDSKPKRGHLRLVK